MFDRFDCVTYVEEVMALAWHADLDEAIAALQRVRYTNGVIDYGRRRHITMAQWIPENIAAGHVRDVTRELGDTETATLELSHACFTSEAGKRLLLKRSERPLGRFAVPVLSADALVRRVRQLPHGSVVTTIREARKNVPYRATHLGLVVVRGKRRYLRHAFQPSGKVIEQRLEAFVKRAAGSTGRALTGFNVLVIAS